MCFDKTILMANLKKSSLKVGCLFLPTTSPVLDTFTKSLARTFRKNYFTSPLKSF